MFPMRLMPMCDEIDEWVSLKSFLKLKRIKDKEKKKSKTVLNWR
jgi:hypothetical protein